jgi:hypothetical protein
MNLSLPTYYRHHFLLSSSAAAFGSIWLDANVGFWLKSGLELRYFYVT